MVDDSRERLLIRPQDLCGNPTSREATQEELVEEIMNFAL
jgi:hypothetical protein